MSVLNTRLQRGEKDRANLVIWQGQEDFPRETDHHPWELGQRSPTATGMCNPELSRRKPGVRGMEQLPLVLALATGRQSTATMARSS